MGGNCWSRGRVSQAASGCCSGGVSAVMGTSDLDDHSVGRVEHIRQSVLRRIASGAEPADVGNGVLMHGLVAIPLQSGRPEGLRLR